MNEISQMDADGLPRFSWHQMRAYWENHSKLWSDIDFIRDPDGLSNVCHAGEALWVNAYYARFQRRVYRSLLATVPRPEADARALDVGCGAGRWCRLLQAQGFRTVGIDLQAELLEENRRRIPDVQFVRSSIQEYRDESHFDLISSVTVLQHLPSVEQAAAVAKLRELTKTGGFVVALENIEDQGRHVFANSIESWQELFQSHSFRVVSLRRYDYSPFSRSVSALRRAKRLWVQSLPKADLAHERRTKWLGIRDGLTWIGVTLDSPIEALLVHYNVPLPSVHCGFLFVAV